MRRFTVAAVLAFAILAMLAPPGYAQAPAPKVTISGLFDQITAAGTNVYDGNLTRNSDHEWYARTRFRPDFEFAVGRVRAVLGIEIDLYTPIFAVSRISGWTAHCLEQYANNRLIRPRTDYIGPQYPQTLLPLDQR